MDKGERKLGLGERREKRFNLFYVGLGGYKRCVESSESGLEIWEM